MLGSTVEEVGGLGAAENKKKRAEQILRNRETWIRVRQVNSLSLKVDRLTVTSAQIRFPRADPGRSP
jgi:hypothetical protein